MSELEQDRYRFHQGSMAIDPEFSWQIRTVYASMGTTTGLIAMAILAKQPKHGPAFGPTCEISHDGKVYTMVRALRIGKLGRRVEWGMEMIGTVESVRDNMRWLADHCRLSDQDRNEMFEELRKWIKKDHRARSEN